MAEAQYDVSKKIQRLYEEKQKNREAIRQKLLQARANPHRVPDVMFDPAIIRFHALWDYRCEHAKPNTRSMAGFLGFVVFPILLIYANIKYTVYKKEEKIRSGQVAYKDRYFKNIL